MLFTSRLGFLCVLSPGLQLTIAQVVPTTPGPNETYIADSNCTIAWKSDTGGTWTNMTIDLMSGPNNNMSFVTNVAMNLDGTDQALSPYVWTCPEVKPYSAIYFYQFTNGNEVTDKSWTTRFTIASPANQSTPPTDSEQPSGEPIPWGTGYLTSKETQSYSSSPPDNVNPDDPSDSARSSNNLNGTDNNENTNNTPQSLDLTPEAPKPTESKSRTAHGHKTTDTPDDEDNSDAEPKSRDSGGEAVSKTKTANIQAEQSQAARASAVAHRDSGNESSLSSDPNPPAGRGANSAAQNNSSSQLDPSSDTGCRCNTVHSANRAASSRLQECNVFIIMLLFVVSCIATILV